MNLEVHPFNDNYGINSITDRTTKLILGTFPAFQVTSNNNPRMNFYYGSRDNKFWDLFSEARGLNFDFTPDNILGYLSDNGIAIIDIIRKCYRRNNNSSADEDLSIVEYQDLTSILRDTNIDTIYSTSGMVTKLLKRQITPLCDKKQGVFRPVQLGSHSFEQLNLPACLSGNNRVLNIKTLFSPSDNGKRGLQKGINRNNIQMDAVAYRIDQYRQLLG